MQDKNLIAYALRQLKFHDRNYTTYALELAIVVCFSQHLMLLPLWWQV